MQESVTKVLIIGGGTAGWMTAAALSKFLDTKKCEITLVESEEIGTIGVGEATLPHLRHFNQTLGISENTFMRATNATYKIGIEFSGWGDIDSAYIHAFGEYGYTIDNIEFHQFYNALRLNGYSVPLGDFSLPVVAAYQNKFDYPATNQRSILSTYSYAFHLDASLYAKFLREYAEARGVKRREGKVTKVNSRDRENIDSLVFEDGSELKSDLYIDCSGGRALLIGEALDVEFESWSRWLPCDRAVAVPSANKTSPPPYTKAMAREAGWQWRIPLQHRTGNGHVYCSGFIDDTKAMETLVNNIDGSLLTNPKIIKFKVGHRKENWRGNCVAIGLSAGFFEPLESTSIHLIQAAITKLLELFPTKNMEVSLRREFNLEMTRKFNSVRDFLILHYHATNRNDSEFWNHCRNMSIPDDLQYRMDLYRRRGYIAYTEGDFYLEPSWLAVYSGQGIYPEKVDPRVYAYPLNEAEKQFNLLKEMIAEAVSKMPSHGDAIAKYCHENSTENVPEATLDLYGRRGRG